MTKKSSRKVTVEQIIDLLDVLPQEKEVELIDELQKWFLKRGLQEAANIDFTGTIYKKWLTLFEELEPQSVNPEKFDSAFKAYVAFVEQIGSLVKGEDEATPPTEEAETMPEDIMMVLEQKYQDLQTQLIQIRQATASTIATEKQIEAQLTKNKEQVEVWADRIKIALQNKNEELAEQARARQKQYSDAALDLEAQLISQKEVTAEMRKRLSSMESIAQKAYTQKQVLIARNRAAESTARFKDAAAKFETSKHDSMLEVFKKQVEDKEKEAAQLNIEEVLTMSNQTEQIMLLSTKALNDATVVFERIEKLISAKEEKAKIDSTDEND